MLIVLMPVAFILFILLLRKLLPERSGRERLLYATLLFGAYLTLGSEFLSLFSGITPLGLAVLWSIPVAVITIWVLRGGGFKQLLSSHSLLPKPEGWLEWSLTTFIIIIVVTTGIVAWFSTPNSWDSLTYHMARVAHWAQNQSLQPYATAIERQIWLSPASETAILHTYVLLGSDRLANFISWGAMVISVLGISLVAKELGANKKGQLLAALFAASLPQGIAQASSTMTDYVLTLWMVIVALETVRILRNSITPWTIFSLGLSTSLAILTKTTALAFLLPFAIIIPITLWKQRGLKFLASCALVVIVLVVMLNAGYITRNIFTFGKPLGNDSAMSHAQSSEMITWRTFLSNLLRNTALHAGTPWEKINDFMYLQIAKIHWKLGYDLDDIRTTADERLFMIIKPSTDEGRIGNVLHATLILLSLPFLYPLIRKRDAHSLLYTLTVIGMFLSFSLLLKYSIWHTRLHTPFFILYAPVIGLILGSRIPRPITFFIALALFALSFPWLLRIQSRPLLPDPGRRNSILLQSRKSMYLHGEYNAQFLKMTDEIKAEQCQTVGILIRENAPEYAIWVFMGAPRNDLRIEWILSEVTMTHSLEDPDFQPCAIICESCPPDWDILRGLPMHYSEERFTLFMK